ncbi:MAG: class I SAM-dependent methyltransferase [Bacteroidales bacterium]|jgi:predicted O-methyltransferase YrrM
MKQIKTFIKNILWQKWLNKSLRAIKIMEVAEDNTTKRLAKSLKHAIQEKELSQEERGWIENIEKIRENIDKNTSEIEVIDYGAGNPEDNRSKEEMYKGFINKCRVCDMNIASKPPFWARVLFTLIREFQPQTSVELGTCLGISSAYQASAMLINKKGKLITMEGSPELVKISQKHLDSLGISNVEIIEGRFQDNLLEVLEKNKPIDYVFIDGHHDEKATIEYYNTFLPYLSDETVLVFDDISWSKGMTNAWNTIIKDQQIKIAINFKVIGICIINKGTSQQKIYNL